MKKLLCIIAFALTLIFALASCGDDEPSISVNDDGYVVVNGVTTEIVADKDDVIIVDEDGYVVVNGTKTEYKIHTTDEISVNSDGYVVVNGVTTEIIADKEDVIIIDDDGYVVVNGVKTEHEIKKKTHSFNDWKLYNEGENDCEKKLYYRTCPDCSTIEWKDGKYEDHSFTTVTTPATCQATGYDTKTCEKCGKVEVCNATPIDLSSHTNGDWIVDVEATCVSNGTRHQVCSYCNATLATETIIAGGSHTFENHFCVDCNAILSSEGLYLELNGDGKSYTLINSYKCNDETVYIGVYNGLPVTHIKKDAFKNNSTIKNLYIGDGIEVIGEYAFEYCTNLRKVHIVNCSLRQIQTMAFYKCPITDVYITDLSTWCTTDFHSNAGSDFMCNPLYQGANLYVNDKLLENFVLPSNISRISEGAFYGCKSIKSVYIDRSSAYVDDFAFKFCSNIQKITSYANMGNAVFDECEKLSVVIIGNEITALGHNGYGCDLFYGCPFDKLYYLGTELDWLKISASIYSSKAKNSVIYYSETEPTESGNYWHYVDGVPVVWE